MRARLQASHSCKVTCALFPHLLDRVCCRVWDVRQWRCARWRRARWRPSSVSNPEIVKPICKALPVSPQGVGRAAVEGGAHTGDGRGGDQHRGVGGRTFHHDGRRQRHPHLGRLHPAGRQVLQGEVRTGICGTRILVRHGSWKFDADGSDNHIWEAPPRWALCSSRCSLESGPIGETTRCFWHCSVNLCSKTSAKNLFLRESLGTLPIDASTAPRWRRPAERDLGSGLLLEH